MNIPKSNNKGEIFKEYEEIDTKELYKEIERKDLVIKNLQKQITSSKSERDIIINSKIEENKTKETNLRSEIFSRDKIIKEKDEEILSLKTESTNTQKEIITLKNEIETLKQEITEQILPFSLSLCNIPPLTKKFSGFIQISSPKSPKQGPTSALQKIAAVFLLFSLFFILNIFLLLI